MSDNKTENVDTSGDSSVNVHQSSSCSYSDENSDCPGGVCPMPKNDGKTKRHMKSPSAVESSASTESTESGRGIPQLDQLFSQLFSSALRSPNTDSTDEGTLDKKSKTSKTSKSHKESDDESEEESEYESDDESGHESDDDDCSVHGLDPRWAVINKLVQSHLNLTRTVADLLNQN